MSHPDSAPRPDPHQTNDQLHPDDRFPGINYPYTPTPPPFNADAERSADQDPRRENPNFLRRLGGWVVDAASHVGHAVKHQAHAIRHDIHETTHEMLQPFNSRPGTQRGEQRHLREQQQAQLNGRHPDVGHTQFASHQRHGATDVLIERLRRVPGEDKLAQRVRIVRETIEPSKEILDEWPVEWHRFIDPRNIIALRDIYLGMPYGNIKNLPPSQKSRMESMLMPIRAGGFSRLPEGLRRAYLGIAPDKVADPAKYTEQDELDQYDGYHGAESAHFMALMDYIDRALQASLFASAEFKVIARQTTSARTEVDAGIQDRMGEYIVRQARHVYDYPQPWAYNQRTNNREQQLAERITVLDEYLANFGPGKLVADSNDRDWDLADPYRAERAQLNNELAKVRATKKTR